MILPAAGEHHSTITGRRSVVSGHTLLHPDNTECCASQKGVRIREPEVRVFFTGP